MPRRSLTPQQKDFVRRYAEMGGNWLADTLEIDRAAIYQFATDEGFSVKKGGKDKKTRHLKSLKTSFSSWPKQYRRYKGMLIKRDGLNCHYCGSEMTAKEAQVDHILARARGGSDAPINLVLACATCNHLKSSLCYTCPEFRDRVRSA